MSESYIFMEGDRKKDIDPSRVRLSILAIVGKHAPTNTTELNNSIQRLNCTYFEERGGDFNHYKSHKISQITPCKSFKLM